MKKLDEEKMLKDKVKTLESDLEVLRRRLYKAEPMVDRAEAIERNLRADLESFHRQTERNLMEIIRWQIKPDTARYPFQPEPNFK